MLRHDITWSNIKKGFQNPRQALDDTVIEAGIRIPATYINTKWTIGTNIFSKNWDVLVLLDTCRVDALREVAPEYDFLSEIDSITSVGARSPEWIAKTFTKKYLDDIQRTAYLSANVFSKQILQERHHEKISKREVNFTYEMLRRLPTVDVSSLGHFENLYEYEPVGQNGELGHKGGGTPPRYVTDRGISVKRKYDFDRMILHYLQPHPPYFANALAEDRELQKYESDWWGYLGDTGDFDTIWKTYLDELRFVLDDVELLLDNLDAEKVIISADHGEAFGEFCEFGHKNGSINPKVRRVPWVETSAVDENTYTPWVSRPSETQEKNKSNRDIDEQLRSLGYKL